MRNPIRLLTLFLLVAAASLAIPEVAVARTELAFHLGYDVSFPQCGLHLPAPTEFAVVGVNAGTPGTRNTCISRELRWARRSHGIDGVKAVSLYVNTDNPGRKASSWPKNNTDPRSGSLSPDRYGTCAGGGTMACAWQFGWNAAEKDAHVRAVRNPSAYAWWMDVETANAWAQDRQLNRAVLSGFTDYFHSLGLVVGVYSTVYQWSVIAGAVRSGNPLFGLPEWITGASDVSGAKSFCSGARLTSAGQVVLSQWYADGALFDGDVACPRSSFRKLRSVS